MSITLHHGDLEEDIDFGGTLAVDTETMGLNPLRDRLCLVQLSSGDGTVHLVKFDGSDYSAPRLKKYLSDPGITKLFHFARFDVGMLKAYLGVECAPVYCTKIASRLVRTFTDKHGLRELCREMLDIELSKEQQSTDWGAPELTENQKLYAARDVLYLHQLREQLDEKLIRENRYELARSCFDFLPTRVKLDLAGWPDTDIFAHS
jgi:ribonuclease D